MKDYKQMKFGNLLFLSLTELWDKWKWASTATEERWVKYLRVVS